MTYAVGSLVKARGREWVVLPESEPDLLMLRPLGGTEDEVTGIYLPLETVESATFALPDPGQSGDYRSARLLRDAVRLAFRSSAGPFRSFARIAVEPRPYQLVPLLVGLKLDPVRVLIADDVGIGKTIEACVIARELMDRGEATRLAVLCPPHLAEQWQVELRDKFHIEAELVLPSTVTRLEKTCGVGQSLFEIYPYVIVSMDFIKSDKHRNDFLRTCPDLVIVDEVHTCAYGEGRRTGRHQRYELLKRLAEKLSRHLILVTATPHSGNEDAFRSLLTFIDPSFVDLPLDLTGRENEHHRRRLAAHFIQRRRADIRHYLQADTPFPERDETEVTYKLSEDYTRLFQRVLIYARETVIDQEGGRHRQRIRWWSALALLRSLASSPAAAAATLRNRAASADTETIEEADLIGQRLVLDLEPDEIGETNDLIPGSQYEDDESSRSRRRLLEMAREADALQGEPDEKLQKAVKLVKELVNDGHRPIIFCRFIPTAEYVAAHLREKLRGVEVAAVTGTLPPAEREERVLQLAQSPKHVLVCTDCLSEGINLQEHFDAVVHYDLSWNPTRHEQREGRVDRYGQPMPRVKVVTYYGADNHIDRIVLEVLIRKHKAIRTSLGISVPVPANTNEVVEAIFEGLLMKEAESNYAQQALPGFEQYFKPKQESLFEQWEAVSEREKRSRTVFAQESIKVDEVKKELDAVRAAIGSGVDVATFVRTAFQAHNAVVAGNGRVRIDLREAPAALREAVGNHEKIEARFELPVEEKVVYLSRTHPIVEGIATYVMDTALDPLMGGQARRCGVIRTSRVDRRTTVLLVRYRYHINVKRENEEQPLLAEDCQLLAFAGAPHNAEWLDSQAAEALLHAEPEANVPPDQARDFVQRVMDSFEHLQPYIHEVAKQRAEELLEAHRRVRTAAKERGLSYQVVPQLPPDVLGIYVYLPVN